MQPGLSKANTAAPRPPAGGWERTPLQAACWLGAVPHPQGMLGSFHVFLSASYMSLWSPRHGPDVACQRVPNRGKGGHSASGSPAHPLRARQCLERAPRPCPGPLALHPGTWPTCSRAGFLNLRTVDIGGQMMSSLLWGPFEHHPPVVTTNTVSTSCQMSPGGGVGGQNHPLLNLLLQKKAQRQTQEVDGSAGSRLEAG